MKSTTYITEITNQKNEKYLSERRNPLAWLPTQFLTSYQLRHFPCEFTEKCFAIFGQPNCEIYLMWYQPFLLFWEFSSTIPFMVWL